MSYKKPRGKIQFPVSFNLKIISTMYDNEESAYSVFSKVLNTNNIPYSEWNYKPSNGKKYASYRTYVTVDNEESFKKMYEDLGRIQGVKCVI